MREIKVVIKTVVDGRADGQFYIAIELAHRLGQHMRERMPAFFKRFIFVFHGKDSFRFCEYRTYAWICCAGEEKYLCRTAENLS